MSWEIDLAREYAQKGHSITFTAQFVGVGHKRLQRMIAAEGADIQFMKGRQSLAFREGLKKAAESRRGRPVSNPAILAGLALGRKKMRERWLRSAFGVTGTQAELHKRFKSPITLRTLQWRTQHGMHLEDALRFPPRKGPPKGITPPQFAEQIKKARRCASVQVHDRILRLLTPTMSQYRAPEHDIVLTAQNGTCITVEVRDQACVLHRLRFVKSFESGVLFMFDPEERGRIQLIAFEPDCPAIIRRDK